MPWWGSEGEAERLSNISDSDFNIETGERLPVRLLKRGEAAARPHFKREFPEKKFRRVKNRVERETADSWGPERI